MLPPFRTLSITLKIKVIFAKLTRGLLISLIFKKHLINSLYCFIYFYLTNFSPDLAALYFSCLLFAFCFLFLEGTQLQH